MNEVVLFGKRICGGDGGCGQPLKTVTMGKWRYCRSCHQVIRRAGTMVKSERWTVKEVWGFRTRDEVAAWYADIIRFAPLEFRAQRINAAIVKRWSVSALLYIKRKAWARADG